MTMATPTLAARGSRRDGPPGLPRLLAGLDPRGATMTLADHAQVHGPLPRTPGPQLIDEVDRSGLRGRGGADFPTATKLRAVAERAGRRGSYLIVNGSETEPASGKDGLLLARLPHLVLDGAVLAAGAVGAREIIVKVGERATATHRGLQSALAVRSDAIPLRLVAGPEGYVTGEESAVVNYVGRGLALPTLVPPGRTSAGTATGRRSSRTRRRSPRSRSSRGTATTGTGSSGRSRTPGRRS